MHDQTGITYHLQPLGQRPLLIPSVVAAPPRLLPRRSCRPRAAVTSKLV